jgi:PAS domain S-box-containing protein
MGNDHQNENRNGDELSTAPAICVYELTQALRVSELSYRRLFEAAQDGILILDVDSGRITDANPFLVKLLGYSHSEMVGQTVGELSPFKDVVSNQAMLERLQKDGYVRYENLPLETVDGRKIAVEFVSNVYEAGDKNVIQCNIRDITQRKLAEIASNRLAAIVEFSNDAILSNDLNAIITSWNKGAEHIFGYTAGEMIGSSIMRMIPADRQGEENHILGKLNRGESVQHFETLRQTKDGRLIDVSVTASSIKDASGKAIGVSKVTRDITQRKRAEAELNRERDLWRALLDNSPDKIYFKDRQSRFVKASKAMVVQFGIGSPEALVGKTDFDFFTDAHARPAFEDEQKIIRTGQPMIDMEEREAWNDGRVTWVSSTKLPWLDDQGKIIGIMGISRDITQRKRAEESNARLATAVEQSIDAIVITDLPGTILYANPAFAKSSGYAVAEAIGQNCRILKSGKQDAEFYRRMWEVLTREETWSGHFINQRKDGTLFEEDATISPVRDAAGTIVNYVGVKRDVTLQMQFEARLRQAQKMESIGQLAGGIAHDFNNILGCIIGYMYLAKIAAADHPAILANLEQISKASDRAVDLVSQILTFSRQNKPEREPVELNPVVLEALKLLRASVPATIRFQIELAETPAVLANATAIHQVIMNLGTNAWHAMHDQPGTFKVETGVWEVDADFIRTHPDLHPGRYVRLSVSDTGCGMDRATVEHVFEPFYTTKGVGEGTGLGLAVVHGIMKTHDGGISVYSQPGEGTTFHLYFPVLETAAVTPKTEAAPIPRGQGERILFVDDEEVLASLGKEILERLGYRVTATTSVLEAIILVRAQAEPFDLVITDLAMPVMDGVKLGEQLQEIQPHLPIILTTGFSGSMTAEKVRALRFRALLSKPSTARTLGETVHRVLHPAAGVG